MEGIGCSEHRAPVIAVCTGCERQLCAGCLELALEGTEQHCMHCHAIAKPIAVAAPAAPTAAPREYRTTSSPPMMPRAAIVEGGTSVALADNPSPVSKIVGYLFARETLIVLAALAAVTAVLRWLSGNAWGMSGFTTRGIAGALEASYYFHIIVHFGGGAEHLEAPDFSSLHDDLIDPLRRYVLTLVPIAAALIWYGVLAANDFTAGFIAISESPRSIFDYPGPGILFVVAVALWPLMTAIAAIGKSVIAAYNPVLWVQTLRLFGKRYVVGVAIFYALLVAETYVEPTLAPLLDIPVVGFFALQMISIMLMAMRACVLGAVCEPYFRD